MRLRNALTAGVTAATIAPAALTASTATAVTSATTVTAAAPMAARPGADAIAAPTAARSAADTALTGSRAIAAITRTAAPMTARLAARLAAHPAAIAAPAAAPSAPPTDKPGGSPAATALPAKPENRPAGRQPTCGKAADPDFPIETRVHGGPPVHHAGGGFEPWSVDLANTTGEACRNIHPVIIFTGRDPGLTPARIRLEFYDDEAALWRPVALETTAEGEVVGVLDGDGRFPGFAVPAQKSVTAKVRLRLAADAPPNQVTVFAAIVQRQGDDGEWVGESGDYPFAVLGDDGSGIDAGIDAGVTPDELATAPDELATAPDELATTGTGTGTGSLLLLGAAFGAVLLGSGALMLASRWRRTRRR